MPWSRKLSAPIVLDDGRALMTLKDAADYVLALPEQRRADLAWQHTIKLMMAAAKPKASKAALEGAEQQLDIVLRADGSLGLKDARSKPPSRPRWRRP